MKSKLGPQSRQNPKRCIIEILATNFIVKTSDIHGEKLFLTGDEARHLIKTLRGKPGDSFYAIDGSGKKYRAVIESMNRSMVKAIISNVTRLENEPHVDITLAMGICRPARMDEVVEKGTELGVSSFQFYYSEKSYARIGDEKSTRNKTSRLVRVARAAAKQSKRTLVPEINEFLLFAELLPLARDYDMALIAENKPESKSVEETIQPSPDIGKLLLMVGPESGLTDDEFDMAISAGFKPVTLGVRRLRAETAGVIFPALVLNRMGDL